MLSIIAITTLPPSITGKGKRLNTPTFILIKANNNRYTVQPSATASLVYVAIPIIPEIFSG